MKAKLNKKDFDSMIYHILCSSPKDKEKYELEIDWEKFGINSCIDKFEELTADWVNPVDWFHYLYTTLCRKNSDYSSPTDAFSNFKMCETLWVSVEDWIKVRLCDKVSRVRNLQTKEPSVVWESLADTYLDIAWYLTLLYIWLNWDAFLSDTQYEWKEDYYYVDLDED